MTQHPFVIHVRQKMIALANPEKARSMKAYMKNIQEFYGIQTQPHRALFKETKKRFPLQTRGEYEQVILELWAGKFREEVYMAIEVAENFRKFLNFGSWPIYEQVINEADWWDTLDWIAARLVSPLVLKHREIEETLIKWRTAKNFWVRRASLLAHIKHKSQTNTRLLAETILQLADEKEFFIRKAIGWVLREYSKTNPRWVREFVETHQMKLSGLSKREALKRIINHQK